MWAYGAEYKVDDLLMAAQGYQYFKDGPWTT